LNAVFNRQVLSLTLRSKAMTQYLSDISVEKAADFLAHRQVGARYVQLPPLSKAAEGPTFLQNLGQRFTDMSSPAKGALIGAIGGGGIGAVSSLFRKDKKHWMRDALTGMVAGGGAGLGAGALYDKISPIKPPPGSGDTPDTPDTPGIPNTPGVPPLDGPAAGAPAKTIGAVPEPRVFVGWNKEQQAEAVKRLSWIDRRNLWVKLKDADLSSSEIAHNIFGVSADVMGDMGNTAIDYAIPDGGAVQMGLGGLAASSAVEPIISGGVNIRNKIKGQGRQWDARPERLHAIEAAIHADKLPPAEAQLKQHVANAKAKDTTGLIDRALRGEANAAQELAQHLNTNPGSDLSKAFDELMGHVDGLEKLETGALNLSTPRMDYSALEAMMARNRQAQGLPSGGTLFGKPRGSMVPNPARGARNLWKKVPGRARGYGALAAALSALSYAGLRGGESVTAPDANARRRALEAIYKK
jgi:hypothetical protein